MMDWCYTFAFKAETIDVQALWSEDTGVVEASPGPETLPADLKPALALENDQCRHCPLVADRSPLCPLAATLIPVTHQFDRYDSTEPVRVIATSRDRTVQVDTNLQRGLGSLLGLLMGGSACPHFAFFRPMASMHLPFSNEDETFFRVISNALLTLAMQDDETSLDRARDHLKQQYQALSTVNLGMTQRLRRCATTDSGINAVIVLDMLARLISDDPEEYIDALRPWYS